MVEPLVVRRADNAVIGGHKRLEAAKALGHRTVPVVYVDVSEAEAKALNLALNKIQGEWDLPKLGGLLEELRDLPDLDETLSGFDEQEMDAILADLERQQLPAPYEESFDAAAEMLQAQRDAAPTRVSKGELWQLGRHRLLCGDSLAPGSLEKLCGDRKVDLVLTDPPYGIGYESTMARRGRRKRRIESDAVEEFDAFLARALPAIKREESRCWRRRCWRSASTSTSSTPSCGTRWILAWDGDGGDHGRRSSRPRLGNREPGTVAQTLATSCDSRGRSPKPTSTPRRSRCRCWRS
jgi:hypothetical protein